MIGLFLLPSLASIGSIDFNQSVIYLVATPLCVDWILGSAKLGLEDLVWFSFLTAAVMLKKASGRAAAAMGCGDPPAPSRPTPKVTEAGTGNGRPASRLLSTRSLPSLFTDSAGMSTAAVPGLSRNSSFSGGRNGSAGTGRSGGVGGGSSAAGLAGVLVAEEEAGRGSSCNKNSRRVLLGMRLRVQLPPPMPPGKAPGVCGGGGDLLPGSPIEFGVKNRDAQLALLSPVQRSPLSSAAPRLQARRSEVEELAEEDYTCVIARGPNPKMTHIFEDRVVESRAGAAAGGGDACCFFSSSSCSGCNKDAALLLQRGEREFCTNQPME